MKKNLALAIGVALLSTASFAQLPPALSDATVRRDDSPMVAAAKRAAAARRQTSGQPIWVIDDSMVGHRIMPITPPQGIMSTLNWTELPSTFSSHDGSRERQQAQEQKSALKAEQLRMSEENDQPYGGDVSEDLAEKRMTEIPRQIEATERQAQPPR